MSTISNDAAKRRIRRLLLLSGGGDLALAVFIYYFGQSVLGLERFAVLVASIGLAAFGMASGVIAMTIFRPPPAPRGGERGGKIVERG